jgi:hypothetical protein
LLRREARIHFRNTKKEISESYNHELGNKCYTKNIRDLHRGIGDFKKGYQPRTKILKDEKGNLVTDCQSNLAKWRNHFLSY